MACMGRNCFLLTSSVFSDVSCFDPKSRAMQVRSAIERIKLKDPESIVLLVDNSLDQNDSEFVPFLSEKVDFFLFVKDHMIVSILKKNMWPPVKGALEIHSVVESLKFLQKLSGCKIKRIFRMTGRYQLMDSFDISYYDNPEFVGKYIFAEPVMWRRPNCEEVFSVIPLDLWSFSFDLIPDILEILHRAFYQCLLGITFVEKFFFEEFLNKAHIQIPMLHVMHQHDGNGSVEIH